MTQFSASPHQDAKTSSQAVWSLILGILSITCLWLLGSIPSIILGILAIRKIDQSGGTLKGRGIGVAGIVTGSVGVIAGLAPIAIVAGLAIPAFSSMKGKAEAIKQTSNIHQVIIACKSYASSNNGDYPKNLLSLVTDGYLDSGELIVAAVTESDSSSGERQPLLYRSGLTDSSPANEPLIAAPQAISGKRTVGYSDGSVIVVPEEEFQANIAYLFP